MPKLLEDARDVCKNCRRKVRWNGIQKGWFHLHNYSKLCKGMFPSTIAEPKKKYV